MATTVGFVQRLTVLQPSLACAFIGPAPANTTILLVQGNPGDTPAQLAFKTSIVDALSAAMTTRQQVQAEHGDTDSNITGLTLGPG
jgi:hypothetical protein